VGSVGNLKPIYSMDASTQKVEDMLMYHMQCMVISMNVRDKESFDESVIFTEYLLEDEEEAYNDLQKYKSKLERILYTKAADIVLKARTMSNSLKKKNFKEMNMSLLEWEYRQGYLKKIVKLYFDREILQHRLPTYAKLRSIHEKGTIRSA